MKKSHFQMFLIFRIPGRGKKGPEGKVFFGCITDSRFYYKIIAKVAIQNFSNSQLFFITLSTEKLKSWK